MIKVTKMTKYEVHFKSIWRKLKATKRMLTAIDILAQSNLSAEHKEDLWAIWWKNKQKELGILNDPLQGLAGAEV